MSKWGPWSSVVWSQPTPNAARREAPTIVLSDQDLTLYGVAPEYGRLVVAECLFCDAVRRIECIAQHMLDEHADELEKKTTESTCPNQVFQDVEPQLNEVGLDTSQSLEVVPKISLSSGGLIETLVIKKKNSSRRRVRPPSTPIVPEIVDLPSTSSGIVRTVTLSNLKRPPSRALLEPSLKRKFSLEKDREYDPNEHCGVVSDPNGKPCCYALGACKAHPVRHRRAVRGRRTSYDELVLEHRARAVAGGAALPDRSTAEMSEGSMSAESIESRSDLPDVEITAELPDELQVGAISSRNGIVEQHRLPNLVEDVPHQLRVTDGIPFDVLEEPPDIGIANSCNLENEIESLEKPFSREASTNRVSDVIEVSSSNFGESSELDYLAETEIAVDGSSSENATDSVVYAEIEVPQENDLTRETVVRVEFPYGTSPHETVEESLLTADGDRMLVDGLEITGEEILPTTPTTINDVPSASGSILHITDEEALRIAESQLDESKASEEVIYEVIAIDEQVSETLQNGTSNIGSSISIAAQLPQDAALTIDDFELIDSQNAEQMESAVAHSYGNPVTNRHNEELLLRGENAEAVKLLTEYNESVPVGNSCLAGKQLDNSTHAAPTAVSLPSPLSVRNNSDRLSSRSTFRSNPEPAGDETGSTRIVGDFRTDAQNRSTTNVFLDETAVNRFAVIVDPNEDTILSSLLFPNNNNYNNNNNNIRYAEADTVRPSEMGLRSTTSSTDHQLFNGEPSSETSVRDGKLRNLLTRGKPRNRSKHIHRLGTERASQDCPGSSGIDGNSPSTVDADDVVAIPFKKPRIHLMMQAQANHLSRICRLTGQSLPEYLRVYLRRPQLVDLRDAQQSSPMSMSDDLKSEVLE